VRLCSAIRTLVSSAFLLDWFASLNNTPLMNWHNIIAELQAAGWTLEAIAHECGFASKGHVHDLKTGHQKSCGFEAGIKLVELHKREMRKKARREA
jgi:hypothetical protein